MIELHAYERAMIVTGDGDFGCLVSYLQKQEKLSEVIGPNVKRCSLLLRRLVPTGILFLDQFKDRFELQA